MKKNNRIFTNDNCTGCNRCIEACIVSEANVAKLVDGKNEIHVDDDHCVRCGMCIDACPHDARDYSDDTERFLRDLRNGEKISLLVAPAVRTNFPEFKRLLGYLKSLGINCIYDVSFGADICTWGYLRYLQKSNLKGQVSQPCPVIVNYIEKHDPSLIERLIPVHSPVMCAAIYMRKYAGITDKLAFLSPCIAKSDEFEDPNTDNNIQYNVTFWMLNDFLSKTGVDYRKYDEAEYENAKHNLGSLFPRPGGLKDNVLHYMPGSWVYQVEGQPEVKHFLDQYQTRSSDGKELPQLVDILNCNLGCNLGTGSIAEDEISLEVDRKMFMEEKKVRSENKEERAHKTLAEFDKKLNLNDFERRYTSKHVAPREILPSELENGFRTLKKHTEEDRKTNCCSCGFATCEEMATAIARDINHKENCVEYNKSVLQEKTAELEVVMAEEQRRSEQLQTTAEDIFNKISANTELTDKTNEEVASIGDEIEKINEVASRLAELVTIVNTELQEYKKMGTEIVDISTMSKLLSLNASIEAVNAGMAGKGFGVVAEEMQKLSEQTAENANIIIEQNDNIFPLLEEVTGMNDKLNSQIEAITKSADDILKAVNAISDAEKKINETASNLIK